MNSPASFRPSCPFSELPALNKAPEGSVKSVKFECKVRVLSLSVKLECKVRVESSSVKLEC